MWKGMTSTCFLDKRKRRTIRMLKMDRAELLAAMAGALCALYTTIIGVFAIPFAGTGSIGYFKMLSISLGFEFPVYIVALCISRKALMSACWVMYAANYPAACIVLFSEKWFPLNPLGVLKTLIVAIVYPTSLLIIAVALLATFSYRAEKQRLARDREEVS